MTAATVSLFHYYTHFVIMLFSLGSHCERYNEAAVYCTLIVSIENVLNGIILNIATVDSNTSIRNHSVACIIMH